MSPNLAADAIPTILYWSHRPALLSGGRGYVKYVTTRRRGSPKATSKAACHRQASHPCLLTVLSSVPSAIEGKRVWLGYPAYTAREDEHSQPTHPLFAFLANFGENGVPTFASTQWPQSLDPTQQGTRTQATAQPVVS